MHQHLIYHLVLIAALFCISPAIYGFWNSAEVHRSVVVKRDFTPKYETRKKSSNIGSYLYRSYHSLLQRANDPEVDGEEDLPSNLGTCVPRCVLTDTARGTDGTKAKRSKRRKDQMFYQTPPVSADRLLALRHATLPITQRTDFKSELGHFPVMAPMMIFAPRLNSN
ncbi:hypothetical protein K469DRAFT_780563 [Zopfia rhizophila CBS 207.26]|uniref:Uncharacterized protein n=1 Tax=Zopfia rhizophila CBS 207.26 TaxID=1314779 RepID=A0A6A6E3Y3_9PEZI|nr:hypothetical protein K469DRAFT_780563 [Zopfia rhizophila CBS 207.26]